MSDRETPGSMSDGVEEWLSEAGPEVPMPLDVERRVQSALAAEAARRAHSADAEVVALRPRGRASRWLAAASVAALAVIGSAIAVPLMTGGGDDSASDSTAVERLEADTLDDAGEDVTGLAESGTQAVPEGGAGDREASAALPPVPDDLLATLDDPAATAAASGCGAGLADELDARVLRGVVVEGGAEVMVVLAEPTDNAAWWLPSCTALTEQALGRSVVE